MTSKITIPGGAAAVEKMMFALKNEAEAANLCRFFKTGRGQYGEGDLFLGIKVPVTRQVVKETWRECMIEDVDQLLASPWHEIRLCALLILVRLFANAKTNFNLRKRIVEYYLSRTDKINNWDLVDLSCHEILGTWLLDRERTVLYALAKNGKSIWEQRIGIVATMQFVRHGQLDDTFAIADILLHHDHDLIHKAVGWLLRETGKHDEPRLEMFLSARYKTMPRTMLRYAIEKFPEAKREAFLKGRI